MVRTPYVTLSFHYRSTTVTKMNIIGIYARSYIDALTIAFAPLTQSAKADTRLRDNRFTAANSRAQTLPRAA